MTTITVTSVEHFAELKKNSPRLLADFWKDSCMNCKMLDLSFQKLIQADPGALAETTLAKLKLEDLGEAIFHAHGVRQAPTLLQFQNGAETARHSGFIPPDKIRSLIA